MHNTHLCSQDIPEEILAEMMLQREECDRIVLSKDTLIQEFERELRNKDEVSPAVVCCVLMSLTWNRHTSNLSRSRPKTLIT